MSSMPANYSAIGCSPLHLPYTATYDGKAARVLVYADMDLGREDLQGVPLLSSHSAVQVVSVSNGIPFKDGYVAVLEVRRNDATPLETISSAVAFPASLLTCRHDTTSTLGLPVFYLSLDASSPALSEPERVVVAVVSAVSSNLQTVAAVGLLRCAPGSLANVESASGIRSLVPVALSGTCLGAVQGALLFIAMSAVVALGAVGIAMYLRGLRLIAAAALTRVGLVFVVWAQLQMGLVVCGARLLLGDTDKGLGALGVFVGAILPVVTVTLAYTVLSRRCYRVCQTEEALLAGPKYAVVARSLILPSFTLEDPSLPLSAAFSTVVGYCRRPSCLWAGLPYIQPVVMLLVSFSTQGLCSPTLISSGVFFFTIGAVAFAILQPSHTPILNIHHALSMALNASVLMIASKLVSSPLDATALAANQVVSMLQVGLAILKAVHMVGVVAYFRWIASKDIFRRCNPDGTLPEVTPEPVFDVQGVLFRERKLPSRRSFQLDVPMIAPLPATPSHGLATPPLTSSSTHISSGHREDVQQGINVENDDLQPLEDDSLDDEYDMLVSDIDAAGVSAKRAKAQPSIQFTLINNHRGYVEMVRPYDMLYDEDDEQHQEMTDVTL